MTLFFQNNKLILTLIILLAGLIITTWQVAVNKATSESQLASTLILPPASRQLSVSFESKASLAIDGSLKNIYFAKGERDKLAIASLTKLVSAVVVWENYDLTASVSITSSAIQRAQQSDGVRIDFLSGDLVRTFDLLSAMLIDSSNEAAYALAEAWPKGGNNEEEKFQLFVQAMNQIAAKAGLQNTVLSDPAGLDDSGRNYSTPLDLAKLAQWLDRYPRLLEMSRQSDYKFYSLKGNYYNLKNPNKLIGEVDGIVLTKTGFTEGAGQSILVEVKQAGKHFIVVLLGAEDRFENAKELIDKVKTSF